MSDKNLKLIEAIKGTIGYYESNDKASFMTGANLALYKADLHYEEEMKQLKSTAEMYKKMYEEVHKDMRSLVVTLNKYN